RSRSARGGAAGLSRPLARRRAARVGALHLRHGGARGPRSRRGRALPRGLLRPALSHLAWLSARHAHPARDRARHGGGLHPRRPLTEGAASPSRLVQLAPSSGLSRQSTRRSDPPASDEDCILSAAIDTTPLRL